jgi:hypothetical protein
MNSRIEASLLLGGAIGGGQAAGAPVLVDAASQDGVEGLLILSTVHAEAERHAGLSSDIPALQATSSCSAPAQQEVLLVLG